MKIVKGIVLFVVAFLCAWILIFTFSQTSFKQTASARILTLWTPAIPIYLYVLGAFCLGLGAGLSLTVYTYIADRSRIAHLTQESAELKAQLSINPGVPLYADDHGAEVPAIKNEPGDAEGISHDHKS